MKPFTIWTQPITRHQYAASAECLRFGIVGMSVLWFQGIYVGNVCLTDFAGTHQMERRGD
jgi:hypothetical protein